MQITKFLVIVALLSLAVDGDNQVAAIQIRDFNGADEDEIMDKVFSKYSVEGKDHNGVKNGQRILMKSTAPKAAGVILEATHKLKGAQVPGYMKANFEKAWNRFDINADGFIRAEETHTFMRSLMGKLNKFALAPGSLSDIGGGATTSVASVKASSLTEEVEAAPKKVVAKKVAEVAVKADTSAEDEAAAEVANVEI